MVRLHRCASDLTQTSSGTTSKLTLHTDLARDIIATFGGDQVIVRSMTDPERLEIEIPRSLVDRGVTEPLSLEFQNEDSTSLYLKVLDLRAAVVRGPVVGGLVRAVPGVRPH